MTAPGYLGQAMLDFAVVPGRVAYLIREGSEEGFRRAVQEACTRWGGQTEPIVPVPADRAVPDWFQQVVHLAGVEAAVNVDVPEDDALAVATLLDLPLVPLAQIDQWSAASSFTVHPSFVGTPKPRETYFLAAEGAPLWHVTVAGDLTPEHLAELNPPGVFHQSRPFPVQRVPAEDEIARAQLRAGTLLDYTVAQFGECWSQGGPSAFPALVWVTDGDNLDDCLWFWNLRALRPLRFANTPMILLPADAAKNWLGYAEQFASALARPDEFSPDVIIGSRSVDEGQLRQLAGQLGLQPSLQEIRSGHRSPAPPREAPFTYLTETRLGEANIDYRLWLIYERRYGTNTSVVTQLFRDSTVIRFDSPVAFSGGGFALVRFSGGPFNKLPRRASTARLVHDRAEWHGATLQLRTEARRDYYFNVRVPRVEDAVQAVLSDASNDHHLSDKGKIGAALCASRDIAGLLQPGAYEAVGELTTPRADRLRRVLRELQDEGVTVDQLVADRLVAEWGHRGERLYRDASQVNKHSAGALETLVDQQWAERGFEIACTTCGVRTFVPMAQVPTRGPAVCEGCQSAQRYTLTKATPRIVYRLDALVDRASDLGVLPHLLVIAVLMTQDTDSSLLPGTDLVFPDGNTPEVDVFGFYKGRVLAGEVKTKAADFTSEQLSRDVDLSQRLRADIHLLAAIDTVPAETRSAAEVLCQDAGLDLLVLDSAELRPGRSA